jgi:hypothetical protein
MESAESDLCSPRVILVEQQGQLRGLITIKDILKEIITHEQFEDDPGGNFLDAELEQSLEEASEWIKEKASLIGDKLGLPRRSNLQLPNEEAVTSLPLNKRQGPDTGATVVFDVGVEDLPPESQRRLGNPFEMH